MLYLASIGNVKGEERAFEEERHAPPMVDLN